MDDSNLLTSDALTVRLCRYAPHSEQPSHSHERASVSVVLSGTLDEMVGRESCRADSGSLVSKPAGTQHRNLFGEEGAVMLCVGGRAVDELECKWGWSRPAVAARHALAAVRHARSHAYLACEERLAQLLELVGTEAGQVASIKARDGWAEEVRKEIDASRGPVRIGALAARVGVHPVSLTRGFRKRYGVAISAYVRRRRVMEASHLLAATDRPIADIAADLQFFDQAHLCRCFSAELGVSPSLYRRLLRS